MHILKDPVLTAYLGFAFGTGFTCLIILFKEAVSAKHLEEIWRKLEQERAEENGKPTKK